MISLRFPQVTLQKVTKFTLFCIIFSGPRGFSNKLYPFQRQDSVDLVSFHSSLKCPLEHRQQPCKDCHRSVTPQSHHNSSDTFSLFLFSFLSLSQFVGPQRCCFTYSVKSKTKLATARLVLQFLPQIFLRLDSSSQCQRLSGKGTHY